ncbi:MAG: AAA family ATPase [Verrucomicrobiaceae bacterium]|nr:AAA family ATPase [Verrucomicrobiaceae bacterium]
MKTPEPSNHKAEEKQATAPKKRVIDPTATLTSPGAPAANGKPEEKPPFRVWTLGELRQLKMPDHINLVGDFHIRKGANTVLVGGWGLGKSFASLWLATLGAKGEGNWLGYKVHRKFKTLIIQTENDQWRLNMDSLRLKLPENFNEMVKIVEFDFGQANLKDEKVFNSLRTIVTDGGFDLIVFDPWNAFTEDNNQERDVKAAIRLVMSLCRGMDPENAPATMILTHVKKGRPDDNHQGRQNAEKAAGSYVLLSNARCVINYDPFTNDITEKRVIVYCTKKNLGRDPGGVTAWEQVDDGFQEIVDFDYEEWKQDAKRVKEPKAALRLEHLHEAMKDGPLFRKELGKRLMQIAGVTDSTVSDYLKKDGGKWFHLFDISAGLLWTLKPEYRPDAGQAEEEEEE